MRECKYRKQLHDIMHKYQMLWIEKEKIIKLNQELIKQLEASRQETLKAGAARIDAFSELRKKNEKLKSVIAEKELDFSDDVIRSVYQLRVHNMQKEIEQLNHIIATEQEQNKELAKAYRTLKESPVEVKRSLYDEMQIRTLQQTIEHYKNANSELRAENQAIKAENTKLRRERGQYITVNVTYTGSDQFKEIIKSAMEAFNR